MLHFLSATVALQLAVIPIMLGVALACYGETTESIVGFVVTALCVILAALKVVLSGEMLTGEMRVGRGFDALRRDRTCVFAFVDF